ncbi:class II aldolase/adducin domain-containing protein [Mycena sp. CBHHK59/15]|nr:class II aldolase/adducin domain-containing protein [Mycena sp. CBHHK59/15]
MSNTDAPVIDEKALVEEMKSAFPRPPTFTSKMQEREWLKFRLAQAMRIFGARGFDEGMTGHITVRDPIEPTWFWVNPFGLHFKLIQPSDLLLVNSVGKIQPESGPRRLLNVAAFMIHAAVHTARPDVVCASHTHSTYGKAFGALGRTLDMISQDACAFYDDCVLSQYRGVAFSKSEGEAIAEALGTKKAAILQNHGLLVATSSVEATTHFHIALEKACEVELLAVAAAKAHGVETVKIEPQYAEASGRTLGNTQNVGWFSGLVEFELLERTEGVKFDFEKTYVD